MNLDEPQKAKVRGWIEEGLKLSEIQKKLASEFGLSMTYMEMRFLLDDLKLKPKEKKLRVEVVPPRDARLREVVLLLPSPRRGEGLGVRGLPKC